MLLLQFYGSLARRPEINICLFQLSLLEYYYPKSVSCLQYAFLYKLKEIVVVSMSGIWNRAHSFHAREVSLYRTMDLRTVPAIFTVPSNTNVTDGVKFNMKSVLANIYNLPSNWLYKVIK